MKIEIRNPLRTCDYCGAGELIRTKANHTLEADLLELFDHKHPWWKPLKRRRFAHFKREVDRVVGELRQKTTEV